MKLYTVYMHKNLITNKVYIGITCERVSARWKNGRGYKGNKYFYDAIKKYGWDEGFSHEILFTNLSLEEACAKEIELIAQYQSNNKEFGYNLTKGGEGCSGLVCSEKTKEKLRKARLGKKHSPETLEKLSKSHKGLLANEKHPYYGKKGVLHPMYGKKHSMESRQKMSLAKQGVYDGEHNPMYGKKHSEKSINRNRDNQPKRQAVICLETLKVYNSIALASKTLNVCRECIAKNCKGIYSQAGGYHFAYLESYEEGKTCI